MHRNDSVVIRQIECAQQTLERLEQSWGTSHFRLIGPLENLADLHFALEQYSDAEQMCWRLLSIATKNYGEAHPAVASALQMLGEVCEVQGLPLEAERFYLWSMGVREKTKSSEEDLKPILTRLASLYRAMRQPFKARIIEMRLARVLISGRHMSRACTITA